MLDQWTLRVSAVPASCRYARVELEDFLSPLLDADVVQDAVLVLHELVANGVDHAGTPMVLTARVHGNSVRLAVRDGSLDTGRARPYDPAAARGRGLQIVGVVSRTWGVRRHRAGKTTWAEIGPPSATPVAPHLHLVPQA